MFDHAVKHFVFRKRRTGRSCNGEASSTKNSARNQTMSPDTITLWLPWTLPFQDNRHKCKSCFAPSVASPLAGCLKACPPTAWFLPGPERMRGGAARRFASDRQFHRGIQAESTCRVISEKATRFQRLAESRSWRAGFFAESREASLRKPPYRKPASGSHLQGSH